MAEITEQEKQSDPKQQIENRRSLMEVLEFLARRGVSVDVIQLAMVRAGISVEVARILAQCVVTTPQPTEPAEAVDAIAPRLPPMPMHNARTGRTAEIALQKMLGFAVMIIVIWGFGITLGFAVGMEMGLVQGVEAGLDRVAQLVSVH
jgi:hypothetical protein